MFSKLNENWHLATECHNYTCELQYTVHTLVLLWKAMHFLYSYLRQACSSFSLLTIVYFFSQQCVHEVNGYFLSSYFQLFVYKSYIVSILFRSTTFLKRVKQVELFVWLNSDAVRMWEFLSKNLFEIGVKQIKVDT